MAKARAIVKRRKSVQNIRKITRTMELIATARFKKALDRATQAEAYTRKIAEIVADLGETASKGVSHPLLERRETVKRSLLLVLTSNRGLAGGYNGNVLRQASRHLQDAEADGLPVDLEVAGKRGMTFFRFRGVRPSAFYNQFEDRPQYDEVEPLAEKYIGLFLRGEIDRLDVAYTRFVSSSRQDAVVENLLPMTASQVGQAPTPASSAGVASASGGQGVSAAGGSLSGSGRRLIREPVPYEFLPDPVSILEEIVPVSFKVRLFKCFLDAAVSEQIGRMIAMKGATENADEMVRTLTRQYNRARQSQITRELAEIIGGAAALE